MGPWVSDRAESLTAASGTIFWSSGCGNTSSAPRSFVRSKTGDGPIRQLYFPESCRGDRVASAAVAADVTHVFWLSGDGHVVSQEREAVRGRPTRLCATSGPVPGRNPNPFGIVVHDGTVYWSEGSSIFSVPTYGGASALVTTAGAVVRNLAASSDGRLLYLAGGRLGVLQPGPGETPRWLGEGVGSFALGSGRVGYTATHANGTTMELHSVGLTEFSDHHKHGSWESLGTPRKSTSFAAYEPVGGYYMQNRIKRSGGPIVRIPLDGGNVVPISAFIHATPRIVVDSCYLYWTDRKAIHRRRADDRRPHV